MTTSPLVIAGLAAAALVLLQRRAGAAAAPASADASRKYRLPLAQPQQANRSGGYDNPQSVAEMLARTVNAGIYGFVSPRPKDIAAGTVEARDAIRVAEAKDGYYGWSGATVTTTSADGVSWGDPYHSGELADSVLAGPVYEIGQDTNRYPWTDGW